MSMSENCWTSICKSSEAQHSILALQQHRNMPVIQSNVAQAVSTGHSACVCLQNIAHCVHVISNICQLHVFNMYSAAAVP